MEIKLGENIRRLRRERGYTQEQLAEALGVSTGAVHKWETGRAVPEIGLLVDLAEFFETSVDALLGYGWQKLSMGQAASRLRRFPAEKKVEEGIRYAEKALQKYPNSFDVVYYSANLYFLSMKQENMPRAMVLYQKAGELIDQNTDEEINALTIQNKIASCCCYMDRVEEAIAIFRKNNVNGMNSFRIGLLLSQDPEKADEALRYLSEALGTCYGQLYNICIGYANAYGAQGKLEETAELVHWLYELGNGLREPGVVNWMDRGNVRLFTILAEVDYMRGNGQGARDWLRKARDTALRFDAAPEHRTGVGLKFYHGSENTVSYDDMGETAMDTIRNYMEDGTPGQNLRPIWEEICTE